MYSHLVRLDELLAQLVASMATQQRSIAYVILILVNGRDPNDQALPGFPGCRELFANDLHAANFTFSGSDTASGLSGVQSGIGGVRSRISERPRRKSQGRAGTGDGEFVSEPNGWLRPFTAPSCWVGSAKQSKSSDHGIGVFVLATKAGGSSDKCGTDGLAISYAGDQRSETQMSE